MSRHPTQRPGSKRQGRKPQQDQESPCSDEERDIRLSKKEAKGGSPADVSVGGEEDAGVGLEFLVRKNKK